MRVIQQAISQPSAPQAQTPAPTTVSNTPAPVAAQTAATPNAVYEAARLERSVIRNRLENLEGQREELVQQMRQGPVSDADRAGLENRLAATDQQIAATYIDLANSEQLVAQTARVPGSTIEPPQGNPWQYGPPEEIVGMALGFSFLLLLPFAIAFARRLWRRSAAVTVTLPPQLIERMESLEQSIDAIAVEVERVGEGQRFVTQLLADRAKATALPAPRSGGAAGGPSA